jgi:hypothetical protein
MPLDRQKMPLGMLSDYVPFEKTSWWRDMLRGIAFNMPGGFLPQRSWFTGSMGVPVVNFSSLDAMDSGDIIGGLVFLPFGALHGPRDNANGIDAVRLYEQYAIARELLERIDAGTVVPACARAYADGEEMTSQNLRNLRIQTLSSLRGCIHQQACRRGRKWRNGD